MSSVSILVAVSDYHTPEQIRMSTAGLPASVQVILCISKGVDAVEAYAQADSRPDAVVHCASVASGTARNAGLKVVQSDWVIPLDPGHKLVDPLGLVTAAKQWDASWAAGAYATLTSAGKKGARPRQQIDLGHGAEAGDIDAYRRSTGTWGLAPSGCFVMSTDAVSSYGGFSQRTDSCLTLLGLAASRSGGGWVPEPVVLIPASDVTPNEELDQALEQRKSELGL